MPPLSNPAFWPRLGLALIGLFFAGQKIWRYRQARRAGLVPPNSRLRRAARVLALGIGSFLVSFILLPLRIELGWPRWLFYPFFAPLLVAVGCIYYSAFLFGGTKTEPPVQDRDRVA